MQTCSIESDPIKDLESLPDDSQIDNFSHQIAFLLGIQVGRYSCQAGMTDQNLAFEFMSEFEETDMIILGVSDYLRFIEKK